MTEMIKKQKQNYFGPNKIKNPIEGRGKKRSNQLKKRSKRIYWVNIWVFQGNKCEFKLETN